jgi:hypothetical protein
MKWVEIIDIDLIKKDKKGLFYEFENRDAKSMLLIKRYKWTISWDHYHTDENKWKNPETIILVSGKIELELKNIKTGEKFKQIFNKPTKFKIKSYIYHAIKALTDIIIIDMNSLKDDKNGYVKWNKLI